MWADWDGVSLVFNFSRQSPFFFKCMRCSVCCSNRSIEVGPYEVLRLSRNLGTTAKEFLKIYTDTEEGKSVLRNKTNGTCVFLNSTGCGVHPDRPLVCRLYPLGLIRNEEGRELFACMPPHPDCPGYYGKEETVGAYLKSQGAEPYFFSENKFRIIRSAI